MQHNDESFTPLTRRDDLSDDLTLAGLGPGHIERSMELARRHLGMDVAYLAEFAGGRQVYRALSGDATSFGMEIGSGPTLDTTYCARMVEDESLSVIPDSAADGRVRDLATTRDAGIGAYVGVPVRLPDGTLYGTFCCLSHTADPTLSPRDAEFLRLFTDLLVAHIVEEQARDAHRADIGRLLAARDLTIALQPVVDLATGRCIGAEALSRFPEGYGPPDRVFAAAHAAGLGPDLERLAVENAFAMLPSIGEGQFLAINVAPGTARELAAAVDDATAREVPWDRLVAEITEHAPVESYRELRESLQPLRDRGLRIAIDDAGAGFASLHHIVELSPDVIKVDRGLIDGIAGDSVRRSVLASFVLLGVELDALVLAEGIETEEDLAVARRLGVRAAQGYLFARPSTDPADHRRWASRPGAA